VNTPSITTTITQRIEELDGKEIQLSSSWLTSCRYDAETQSLTINMQRGGYDLTGVPPDTFLDFIDAPSPGYYFNTELKGKY
jgi:hypothetical protein